MNPRMPHTSLSLFRPSVVLSLLAAAPAVACVQGHEFHAPKPLRTPIGPRPLEVLTLEPFKPVKLLESVSVPPPLPQLERPPVAATMPDLRAAFSAYVTKFEQERAGGTAVATHERRIDYAVALIRLGRTAEAIAELEAIEAAQPGKYETAANLGTAYELAGKLEDAIVWIERGIERNPQSHEGTEWLHVAILKAKLKLRDDPAWLRQHSVLDGAGERTAEEIVRAIDYQLGERLVFVSPENAAVCDLFYQAAQRVPDGDAAARARREHYLRESLRFGDWRKAEVQRALNG